VEHFTIWQTYHQLKNLLDRSCRESCLWQASKSNFGVVWSWSLISWAQKLIVSSPCSVDHLCQFSAESAYSFSKYGGGVKNRLPRFTANTEVVSLDCRSCKLLLMPLSLNGGCCSSSAGEFWSICDDDGETILVTDGDDDGCLATSRAASASLNTANWDPIVCSPASTSNCPPPLLKTHQNAHLVVSR